MRTLISFYTAIFLTVFSFSVPKSQASETPLNPQSLMLLDRWHIDFEKKSWSFHPSTQLLGNPARPNSSPVYMVESRAMRELFGFSSTENFSLHGRPFEANRIAREQCERLSRFYGVTAKSPGLNARTEVVRLSVGSEQVPVCKVELDRTEKSTRQWIFFHHSGTSSDYSAQNLTWVFPKQKSHEAESIINRVFKGARK
jgi:hypothetical protein